MFQSGCEPGVAVAAARESGARERGESDQASHFTSCCSISDAHAEITTNMTNYLAVAR